MALVNLSPWPTTPVALQKATECLKQVLSSSLTDDRVQRFGSVAAAYVERYAPAAPANVRSIAVEMFSGYLSQAGTGPVTKIQLGNVDIERRINHAAAFRLCGAASMLSEWKVRNAGLITGTYTDVDAEEDDMTRTQLTAVDLSETAVNIISGLSDGDFEFQRSIVSDVNATILYSFGDDSAPANDADYFTLDGYEYVAFSVPGNVWAKVLDTTQDYTASLAISTVV